MALISIFVFDNFIIFTFVVSFLAITLTISENSKSNLYMDQLVLWVPNFSEGRDKKVIEAIANEATKVPGCVLLDVSTGYSTHRTVYTFAGPPDAIIEAAIASSVVASKLIDMSKHSGEHPRLGAMDVSPIIPLKGITFDECVIYSKKLAEKLAKTLNVPVYLYGKSADKNYRDTVPKIRAGEYEELSEKLKDPAWKPDYGPTEFVPSWGATMVGCRDFLIAYNINVLSTKEQAHTIAIKIRESGSGPESPGKLANLQALGWMLDEDKLAQVSTNIIDFRQTPIWKVFEEVLEEAKELKIPIVGSEIIGLIPKEALLECANHYIEKEEILVLDEDNKIKLAIDRLGLNTARPFDKNNQIIEYKLKDKMVEKGMVELKLRDFVSAVSSRTAVPGGGAVSALVASLGSALACMVGLLSSGNKKYRANNSTMKRILPQLYDAQYSLLEYVEEDSRAFRKVLETNRMIFKDQNQKILEQGKALREATDVPLKLARKINLLWDEIEALTEILNPQVLSDLQVSVRLLNSAVHGCKYNVLINLKGTQKDEDYKNKTLEEIKELSSIADVRMSKLLEKLNVYT